jgi:hypothetical protein
MNESIKHSIMITREKEAQRLSSAGRCNLRWSFRLWDAIEKRWSIDTLVNVGLPQQRTRYVRYDGYGFDDFVELRIVKGDPANPIQGAQLIDHIRRMLK